MKHNKQIVDLSTSVEERVDCNIGEGYCIDWYYQTWENGILINEEYLYTTCSCYSGSAGGGGAGNPNPSAPQDVCAGLASVPLGGTYAEIESYSYLPVSPLMKTGSYVWKFHTAGSWWFDSYESSVLVKANNQVNTVWEF